MAIKYLDAKRIRGSSTGGTYTSGLGSDADPTLSNSGGVSSGNIGTTHKLGAGSLDFNGSNSYVSLGTDSGLNLLNGGTVAMWVNTDNITDLRLAGKGSNGAWELLSETTNNVLKFRVNDGSVKNVVGTTALSDGTWYHVAGVYDKSAGEIKLYVNGALENTTTGIGQIATVSTATYLGRNEGGAYYEGLMDDVGIWNTVLPIGANSSAEGSIKYLYNGGTGRLASTIPTGLLAHYNMDSLTMTNGSVPTDEKATLIEASAVKFDSQAYDETSSNGTTLTVDITIGDNDNRILIVSAGSYNLSPTISGVTFGSQSLTKIDDDIIASDGRSYLWYLLAPTVGTDTITVTWSGTAGRKGIGGLSLYNAEQTAPVNVNTESSTSTNAAGGDVTPTTAGSAIVDGIFTLSGGGAPTGNQTLGWSQYINSNDRSQGTQYNLSPTIGSANSMSWTIPGGAAGFAWVGCEVKCENQAKALPENTLFEETDTYKTYWLQDNEWKNSFWGKTATGNGLWCGGATPSYITTNQVATDYVWGTSTALNSARGYCAGAGYKSAFIVVGGWDGSIVDNSAVWNGSSWATEVTLNTERRDTSAIAGNSSDCIVVMGRNAAGTIINTAAKWNGSTWTSAGTITTTAGEHGCGDGTSSDMMYTGGYGGGDLSSSGLYNGTTWSTGVSNNWASYGASLAGANTSAMHQAGGNYANSATFNGTSWTNATVYDESGDTTTIYCSGGGVSDSHWIMGTNNTDKACGNWNGTSWETKGDMSIQVYAGAGDGSA